MNRIKAEYTVTLGDFRRATYYALAIRSRTAFLIAAAFLLAGLCLLGATAAGLASTSPLFLFITAASFVWFLMTFARAEGSIRTYLRSDGCLIGRKTLFTMEGNRIGIEIPEKRISAKLQANRLGVAFEISTVFLLYTNASQVYIVPRRAFTEEELRQIRKMLKEQLPGRFSSRFS